MGSPHLGSESMSHRQVNPSWRRHASSGTPFPGVVPGQIIRAWMRREGRPASRNRTSCSACDDARTDRMPTSRGMRRLRLDLPNWRQPSVESGLPWSMPPQRFEPLSRNASRSLCLSEGRALCRHRCRSLSTGRPPSMRLTEGRSPGRTPPGCRSPILDRSTEPARHRGGAAAACCPGSSPGWRCWPRHRHRHRCLRRR